MTETLDLFPELKEDAPMILSGSDVITEGTRASWAVFSSDRRHRYLLCRQFKPVIDTSFLVVGMLNPSTAGATEDDPTIRKLIHFAKRDGHGSLLVWNVFSIISSDPSILNDPHNCSLGPRNIEAIKFAMNMGLGIYVVAWGVPKYRHVEESTRNVQAMARSIKPLHRFGKPTKDGYPRHPLYLRNDTPIERHR